MSDVKVPASLPAAAARNPESLQVLLVEDVPVQRKMLERMLSNMGHVVETATNGDEALARILEDPFDVLVTDWDMPGMDGPTLCTKVRAARLERDLDIYIVMLTSHDSVNDFVTGITAGADEYVRKPANSLELQARLNAGRRIIQLERSLRAAKATDSRLHTYSREYLDQVLPKEIQRARRYAFAVTLIMADLDRFKDINDEYGHLAGDETLKEFCDRARDSLRQSADWIARYGGEEFAVVLPQTGLAGAQAVAEKLRVTCSEKPIVTSAGPLALTVSLGVAVLLPEGDMHEAARQLLQHADAALYKSKRDGRNRVTVWVPE
jgi:two-component system, cell cycle response regulator